MSNKLTKNEAFKMNLCEVACGLWCNRAKKCNGDLLAKINSDGHLVSDHSEFCRASPEAIEIFKREYNWNPNTGRIYKR
jgi:hypothetical protein